MAGTITEGRNVGEDRTLTPDFCIIGSGAGGGVCALKLTEAGFDVLVLEEGIYIPKEDGPADGQKRKMLNEREVDMYKLLYQEGGHWLCWSRRANVTSFADYLHLTTIFGKR